MKSIIENKIINIKEASQWASNYTGKKITPSNISYLIQYGRIKKYGKNGNIFVDTDELKNYYSAYKYNRETLWGKQLGEDLNWELSFEQYKEFETTKHVHRLHPYKGKFIPQLVEYFLDSHTDNFKKEVYFKKGDIILDPFCGSGTTLIQANELNIHAIGIDISEFNAQISNCKIKKYNLIELKIIIDKINKKFKEYIKNNKILEFDNQLTKELNQYNNKYFPVPEYKYRIKQGRLDEKQYGKQKEEQFLKTYNNLLKQFNLDFKNNNFNSFIDKWYFHSIRYEIEYIKKEIENIKYTPYRNILQIILSRTMRSCRATTHADLATLKEPITKPYYCSKHGKICKPLFTINKWWNTYINDTLKRLSQFDKLRTNSLQICLTGDSRSIDIKVELEKKMPELASFVAKQKIKGIFTSPPYVGLIDYHEQHAYAYELFGFNRNDDSEIGPLFRGQGKEAREIYIDGISKVLLNCKKYLTNDYNIFIVANDKFNLYPTIAKKAKMKIVKQFKRPVLNRTEKDKGAYSELILHIKEE